MSIQEILEREPNLTTNPERTIRLYSLVRFIPHQSKSSLLINRFVQFALDIDYLDFYNLPKRKSSMTEIATLKNQLELQELKVDQDAQPFERLLVQAINKHKCWEEIIQEHQIDRFFNVHPRKWQIRDVWILRLCFSKFSQEQSYSIACRLLNKSMQASRKVYYSSKQQSYYEKQLSKWLRKPKQQLHQIYDEEERNMVVAFSANATFIETYRMLSSCFYFRKKSEPSKYNFYWICYLSHKCQDNNHYEYPFIHWKTLVVTWASSQSYSGRKFPNRMNYQIKLAEILSKYQVFDQYFSNEVEVILLTAIKKKVSWKVVKEQISSLFGGFTIQSQAQLDKTDRNLPKVQDDEEQGEQFLQIQWASLLKNEKQCSTQISEEKQKSQSQIQTNSLNTNIQDQSSKLIEKAEIQPCRKSAIKSKPFILNRQQSFMLYLLERGRHNLFKIESEYFSNIPNSRLHLYSHKNRPEMAQIASQQVKYYCQFPEKVDEIGNDHIKSIVRALIAISPKQISILKKQQVSNLESEEQDISGLFVEGYKKIVEQMGLTNLLDEIDDEARLSNQQGQAI